MIRRAVEWVFGSVVVYVLVAACATYGGGDIIAMATGGIMALVGGTSQGGTPAAGGKAAGTGAASQGASGGISIVDPVPDADAAEDGTRIVNIYRTTADGLRTPEGYWDTQLGMSCSFVPTSDGKDRCLPTENQAGMATSNYADASCILPVAMAAKGTCPKYGYTTTTVAGVCGRPSYVFTINKLGDKLTRIYGKSGDTCEDVTESLAALGYDYYAISTVDLGLFAEGTWVHE